MTKVKIFNKKSLIAVALILIAVTVFFLISDKSGYLTFWYSPSERAAVVFTDDKMQETGLPGSGVSNIKYNGAHDAAAVLMSDDTAYTLFGVCGGKSAEIIKNSTNNFLVSYAGKTVAYTNAEGQLFLGSLTGKNGKEIAESVPDFALSPNGKTVLYAKNEENTQKLYVYSGGKSTLIADNYTPLAVSDDLNYLYVLSFDDSLCILNTDGTMKAKLCSGVRTDSFYFSYDMKSVVFSDSSYSYVSHEGKSRVRLIPGKAAPVFADGCNVSGNTQGNAVIVNDEDLSGLFYVSKDAENGDVLFFITASDERISVSDGVKKYVLTGKNSAVYMNVQGSIYSFDGSESVLVVSGARSFEASDNGKYIYYTDASYGLSVYCKGENTVLASSVAQMGMTSKNKLPVMLTDGSMYIVSGKKISDKKDDGVHGFFVTPSAAFYSKNYNDGTGTFALYASDGSAKFKKSTDAVMIVK